MRDAITERLLGWYDIHARALPWRVGPADRAAGIRPDPYRVWLSEVMLQQTTVAAVKGYFERFTTRWPDVQALAAAPDEAVMAEWAGLGYYARARNLLACARAVAARGGFPETEAGLRDLPGIGAYTAAAVASIAFDEPAVVVDGNVERVVSRLFALQDPLPGSRPQIRTFAARLTPDDRPGDHAQAIMDLGATICSPRKPACGICPVLSDCEGARQGIAADLPRKAPKPEKPTRFGTVYIAQRRDGAVLVERRPPKGLLGGMPGWPGNVWAVSPEAAKPPVAAEWLALNAEVRHTFTHFHLILTVQIARPGTEAIPRQGTFLHDFDPGALPTVMRKAWDLAAPHLDGDAS